MLKHFLKSWLAILLLSTNAWGAVAFDGTDDLIDLGSPTILGDQVPSTICAWINLDNGEQRGNIYTESHTTTTRMLYELSVNGTSDNVRFEWKDDTVGLFRLDSGDVNVNGTGWHCVCGQVVSTTHVELFFDGDEVGDDTTGNNSGGLSMNTTHIGARETSTINRLFLGTIGEVVGWSSELSDAEIGRYCSARVARLACQIDPANIVNYWTLDDGEGTSADGDTFKSYCSSASDSGTGDDGAGNTGLSNTGTGLSYP